jgi:hypothetical protein
MPFSQGWESLNNLINLSTCPQKEVWSNELEKKVRCPCRKVAATNG